MGQSGGPDRLDRARVAELVRQSTARQGLPELIEDRVVLARVAILLAGHTDPISRPSARSKSAETRAEARPLLVA